MDVSLRSPFSPVLLLESPGAPTARRSPSRATVVPNASPSCGESGTIRRGFASSKRPSRQSYMYTAPPQATPVFSKGAPITMFEPENQIHSPKIAPRCGWDDLMYCGGEASAARLYTYTAPAAGALLSDGSLLALPSVGTPIAIT